MVPAKSKLFCPKRSRYTAVMINVISATRLSHDDFLARHSSALLSISVFIHAWLLKIGPACQ
jgi:hypothetical protein